MHPREHERRRSDRALHIHRLRDSLGQHCLSRAQWPREHHDIAGAKLLTEPGAEYDGVGGGGQLRGAAAPLDTRLNHGAGPARQPPRQCDELGRGGALDQADQRVVDGLRLLQLHQMSCAADDHEFGLRQCGRHGFRVLHRGEQIVVTTGDQRRHLGQRRQRRRFVVDLERVQEFHQGGDRGVVHHLLGEGDHARAYLLVTI